MIVVSKFGGSSVSDAKQFKKVKDIILAGEERKAIVISAVGKSKEKAENKITDLLYLLHAHLVYGVDYKGIYNSIKERFINIRNELCIDVDLNQEFDNLEKEFSKNISKDYLVSRGEYFTSMLMAKYIGYKFIDAKDVIHFLYDGSLDIKKTDEDINNALLKFERIIIPGFYGSYPNKMIKILSRGGSDVTGSIVSKAVNASLYENWTDVSGILVTDPKIVINPVKIKEITYDELRELSYMGANVLHEETIFPVQELNIPIKILNTNYPEEEGTIITNKCLENSKIITGIAGKKNFSSFNIVKKEHYNKLDLIRKVLDVFSKYQVNIEHIPTGIDSFSVVVSTMETEKVYFDLISDLNSLEGVSKMNVENEIALIAVVGRNMATKPGTSGKIFEVLGKNKINVKMIAQGANEINIIVGVSNIDFEKTIEVIYNNVYVDENY